MPLDTLKLLHRHTQGIVKALEREIAEEELQSAARCQKCGEPFLGDEIMANCPHCVSQAIKGEQWPASRKI